jgi:hypothetical protein
MLQIDKEDAKFTCPALAAMLPAMLMIGKHD